LDNINCGNYKLGALWKVLCQGERSFMLKST
jgi:hypothetical protein